MAIHAHPMIEDDVTPCCGHLIIDLPDSDDYTADWWEVTCNGAAGRGAALVAYRVNP